MSESGKTRDVDSVHIWALVGVSLLTLAIFVLLVSGVLRISEMGEKALLAGVILLLALASCVYFVCNHRVADCLWMFVWSWGTALALFIPITGNNTNTMLAELTPRLFVVWFLSLLTMVATLLLARMSRLAATQDKLSKLLDAADAWNTKTERAFDDAHKKIEEMQDHARIAIKTAASAVNVVEMYTKVQELEQKIWTLQIRERSISKIALLQDVRPTRSFLHAANRRLGVIAETGERVRARAEVAIANAEKEGTDTDKAHAFLISNILLPSFLAYLGSDPWHKSESSEGLKNEKSEQRAASVIQEGSYLQYAGLIEGIFREADRCIEGFGAAFPTFSIEMFTTLNVFPRRLLNAIDGSPSKGAYNSTELDTARTNVAWERYRAVQAFAVRKGRASGRLALTRCFVTKTPDEYTEFENELRCALLGRESARTFDGLAKKLEASRQTRKREDYLHLLDDDVKSSMDPLKVTDWSLAELRPIGINAIPKNFADGHYAHKVAMRGAADGFPAATPDFRAAWRPLVSECLWRYFSSPARALWAHGPLNLPQDIFVVGVAKNSKVAACPSAIEPAFVITLDTTEGGTITITSVLFRGDTQEVGASPGSPLTFEDIQNTVNSEILGGHPQAGVKVWPLMNKVVVATLLKWEDDPALKEFLYPSAAVPAT